MKENEKDLEKNLMIKDNERIHNFIIPSSMVLPFINGFDIRKNYYFIISNIESDLKEQTIFEIFTFFYTLFTSFYT